MQGVALCNPLAAELIPEPVEGVEAKDTLHTHSDSIVFCYTDWASWSNSMTSEPNLVSVQPPDLPAKASFCREWQ